MRGERRVDIREARAQELLEGTLRRQEVGEEALRFLLHRRVEGGRVRGKRARVGHVREAVPTAFQLGAHVAKPAEDMQGVGRVGYLLDPDNNVFGMISAVMSDGTTAMAAER